MRALLKLFLIMTKTNRSKEFLNAFQLFNGKLDPEHFIASFRDSIYRLYLNSSE